ncbi:MAG: DNA polymerase IV [Gammaproteobacteria bacterium]
MILHIDMDAFYASVEEREQPALRGRPLAVGGRPEARGVVAAANYAARAFGIHSAMPSALAVRRCADLILLPPRGQLYAEVGAQIREIFHRYTPLVEPLSLDEAFLDPRGSERLHGDAETIGKAIKRDILDELRLVASVGVAPNKFLAKLASGHDKPDGFTVLTQARAQEFLDALPVGRMWGVGKSAEKRLHGAGVYHVLQLRRASPGWLKETFGAHGERLWQLAHGIDARAVAPESEVKSISHETTFAADINAPEILLAVALDLCESVCYRLRRAELRGRTVTLKIRFEDFSTITRARSLPQPSDATDDVWQLAGQLLRRELAGGKFSARLLGVGVSNFGAAGAAAQGDLFARGGEEDKRKRLDALSDAIKARYGKGKIRRGGGILWK